MSMLNSRHERMLETKDLTILRELVSYIISPLKSTVSQEIFT